MKENKKNQPVTDNPNGQKNQGNQDSQEKSKSTSQRLSSIIVDDEKKIDTKPSDEYFNMRIKGVEDENKTVVQPSHPFQLPVKLPVNKEKNDAPVSPKITTIVKSDDVITNGKKRA